LSHAFSSALLFSGSSSRRFLHFPGSSIVAHTARHHSFPESLVCAVFASNTGKRKFGGCSKKRKSCIRAETVVRMMMVVQSVASVHDLVFVNGPDIEKTRKQQKSKKNKIFIY
jgi:hypothetical protein